MDRKQTGKLWIAGCMFFLLGSLVSGCSSRWSPTDPRLDDPNSSKAVVLERWEIGVNASLEATP